MFDTIIWATDGSAHADHCRQFARKLARRHGATVRIVHVVETLAAGTRPGLEWRDEEECVVAKLKAQSVAMRHHGVRASLHVIRGAQGPPARHLADLAAQVDADLIILSVHGRSALHHKPLMGSVARRLLEISPCPVLVLTPAWQRRFPARPEACAGSLATPA